MGFVGKPQPVHDSFGNRGTLNPDQTITWATGPAAVGDHQAAQTPNAGHGSPVTQHAQPSVGTAPPRPDSDPGVVASRGAFQRLGPPDESKSLAERFPDHAGGTKSLGRGLAVDWSKAKNPYSGGGFASAARSRRNSNAATYVASRATRPSNFKLK
jgi:hypothetical protein